MSTYRVDFGRPISLFPLPGVPLLPHALSPFHIFEPRYRQMIEHTLASGSGELEKADPIAFAVVDQISPGGDQTSIRDAVCIGRITRLERYQDGRFDIVVHGVCRAKIDELDPPDSNRLYLRGWLRPLESDPGAGPAMPEVRRTIRSLLRNPRLSRLSHGEFARQLMEKEEVPTTAILDLIGFTVLQDPTLRYEMLAEGDCRNRAGTLTRELQELDRLVALVDRQAPGSWPKGLSWN
jgi:Lon protease-like protein